MIYELTVLRESINSILKYYEQYYAVKTTMAEKLKKCHSNYLLRKQSMLAGDHIPTQAMRQGTQGMLACERVSLHGMLTRQHVSTEGMSECELVSTQDTLALDYVSTQVTLALEHVIT